MHPIFNYHLNAVNLYLENKSILILYKLITILIKQIEEMVVLVVQTTWIKIKLYE